MKKEKEKKKKFLVITNPLLKTNKVSIAKTTTSCFSYRYEKSISNKIVSIKLSLKSNVITQENLAQKNSLGIRVKSFTNCILKEPEKPCETCILENNILDKKVLNLTVCSKEKDPLGILHKINRKLSYILRSLNQKYGLLTGKTAYSCGSTRGLGHVSLEGDKKKNSVMNNISHCNSVYQCRVCATRILSRRQLELESINKKHIEFGGSVLLLSLTIKNSKKDSFESLLGSTKHKKGILWAYANLSYKYKRRFQKLLDFYSVDFSVRVFESTWGSTNGFHVHTHSLFYLKRTLTEQEMLEFKKQFYKLWKKSLKDVGLTCNFENGVDIQDGSNAGKYIAKWSGASELSSGHAKKAKNGNYTMSQLNNLLLDDSQIELPFNQVKAVLSEYYKGCHGKKFMTWSGNRKLKDKYLEEAKLEKLSDEECVESSNIESKEKVVVGNITFKDIYKQNKVHEFRTSFELGSFEGVLAFARSISLSTKDIHFVKDVDLTDEDKLKKIDYFISEYGFFPDINEIDLELMDYYVLNYENLINTAIDYYDDPLTLAQNNAYYPYVLEFCKQYAHLVLIQNS